MNLLLVCDHPAQTLRTVAAGKWCCVESRRSSKLLLPGRTRSYRYPLLPGSLTPPAPQLYQPPQLYQFPQLSQPPQVYQFPQLCQPPQLYPLLPGK